VCDVPAGTQQQMLLQALNQLTSAIDLLDQAKAPAHIAAHVDLAVSQLRDALGSKTHERRPQIARNAEAHWSTS